MTSAEAQGLTPTRAKRSNRYAVDPYAGGTDSPMVDRHASEPLWRQIERRMLIDIVRGRFRAGAVLPTESELAHRFGVHRNTVRRAIEPLKARGLIRVELGRGMYVRESSVSYELTQGSTLSQEADKENRFRTRRFLHSSSVRASSGDAELLLVEKNSALKRIDVLELVDDQCICISSDFFPLPRFETIASSVAETGSITTGLARCGVTTYSRAQTRISAADASLDEAQLLGLAPGASIMRVTNVNVDETGKPIQLTHARWSARWIEMVVRFLPQIVTDDPETHQRPGIGRQG